MAIKNTTSAQEQLFQVRTGETFSFFYEKFNPRLVYYIKNIVKDEHTAEDIASEAFIKAYEVIDTYDKEKAQFSTWLFRIGINAALQQLKKIKRNISMDIELDSDGTTMKDFIHEVENKTESLHELNDKKVEIISKYINELKQPYKDIIIMREIKEMSYKDIAIEMGKDIEFELNVFNDMTNVHKLDYEISTVYDIVDANGNSVDYTLIESDEAEWYKHIQINTEGNFKIKARCPKNLSTIKSQIKCSRTKLMEVSKKEFQILDELYIA